MDNLSQSFLFKQSLVSCLLLEVCFEFDLEIGSHVVTSAFTTNSLHPRTSNGLD